MTEIVVTDCGDCPFYSNDDPVFLYTCNCPGNKQSLDDRNVIFATCPLKTNSIQITLKKDDDGKRE